MSETVSGSANVHSNTTSNLQLLLPITGIGTLQISISPISGSEPNHGTCYLPSSTDAELYISSGEFGQLGQKCPKGASVSVSLNYESYTGTENNVNTLGCAGMTITFSSSASAAA